MNTITEMQRRVFELDVDGVIYEIRNCGDIEVLETENRLFKICPVCGGRRRYRTHDGIGALEHEKLYSDVVQ